MKLESRTLNLSRENVNDEVVKSEIGSTPRTNIKQSVATDWSQIENLLENETKRRKRDRSFRYPPPTRNGAKHDDYSFVDSS